MSLLSQSVADLASGLATICALSNGLEEEQIRRRPTNGGWTLLEVFHHLWEEEQRDFPVRLRLTLEDPTQLWPGIDPPAWVDEHRYNEADLSEVMAGFRREREGSLAWLKSLESGAEPAWDRTHQHPLLGPISARKLLLSWRAHDLLHSRQILRLRWDSLLDQAPAGGLDYAGSW